MNATAELVEFRLRPLPRTARELDLSRQWLRVGVAPASEKKRELVRLRNAYPRSDWELDTRQVNPSAASLTHHHIPPRVTQLGWVLDLTTQLGETVTEWDSELRGWRMLTDARAETMRPGAAALYLVRDDQVTGEACTTEGQEETYRMWHKRDPDETLVLDTPDFCGVFLGLAKTIGYDSDKWTGRGKFIEYEHDFSESGLEPEVWADAPQLGDARGVVIRGGDMRVTPAGID
jgi:hypothetical protein